MLNSITFNSPGFHVGGTNLLWARLAEVISTKHNLELFIIDYNGGFTDKYLKDRNIRYSLIEYKEGEPTPVPEGTYVILPLLHASFIRQLFVLPRTAKFFFWNTHPVSALRPFILNDLYLRLGPNYISKIIGLLEPRRKSVVSEFLKKGAKNSAIYHMDLDNYLWTRKIFGICSPPKYWPIPMTFKQTLSPTQRRYFDSDEINIGWLGRFAIDKINSIVSLMEEASRYSEIYHKKITFHIIGDGPKRRTVNRKKYKTHIKVKICGTMIGSDLDEYLKSNVDVLFAMGSSCLEGARLSLPTVIVPFSYNRITRRRFKMSWLHKSEGFVLGWHVYSDPIHNTESFENIMNRLNNSTDNKDLGMKCLEYLQSNHNLNNIADLFIQNIKDSAGLTIEDIDSTRICQNDMPKRAFKHFAKLYKFAGNILKKR